MPRFDSGCADGGLVVEGIYASLLVREREKCLERDPRREPGEGRLIRPRGCLDALEAGRPVIVGRGTVELQMHILFGGRQKLPWDRAVRSAHVSAEDVVTPSDEEHPWYGRAAAHA